MFTFKACPNRTKCNTHSTERMGEGKSSSAHRTLRKLAPGLALMALTVLFASTTGWA